MNDYTGEIQSLAADQLCEMNLKTTAAGLRPLVELRCMPDPFCRRCQGVSHLGFDTTAGRYMPCRCCRKLEPVMPTF